jgi:hypothetical protein
MKAGKDGEEGSYPIFVNWNSSFPSTWWDHVAHVHKGLWTGQKYAVAFPYFVAVDEVKSLVEAPLAWFAEVRHTFPRVANGKLNGMAIDSYQNLVESAAHGIKVNDLFMANNKRELVDDRKISEKIASVASLPLTLPTKILAPPLLIQAAGTGSWDIMQRRTGILLQTEKELGSVSPDKNAQGAALAHFITRFQNEFLPQYCATSQFQVKSGHEDEAKVYESSTMECEDKLQITLVGHSMGTIIVDQLLRYAPNMTVRNIVFMAGATTVSDYRDTITAYMGRHQKTQMYHLILHPLAEVSEKGFLDLSPRGSLLVWIDNYFTNPITPLDRSVGRFFNLLPELNRLSQTQRLNARQQNDMTEKSMLERIHLKIFRIGNSMHCQNPQRHGDFGLFPFWDPRFWDPGVPRSADQPAPYVRWDDRSCGQPL